MLEPEGEETWSWARDWSGHSCWKWPSHLSSQRQIRAEACSRTMMSQWMSELGFDHGSL